MFVRNCSLITTCYMQAVLNIVGGIAMVILAELVGMGFFWLVQGRKTYAEKNQEDFAAWSEGRPRQSMLRNVRNEVVGGIILAPCIYVVLKILGKI